ncbi:helix-turn-helix transcriptional regulator [Pseudomonas sp.]|uniref:ArsR/SmtB family transcription factor n=1 Tax=Pseudomonas sp. TaxID=306 RepID=UPI002736FDF9|nr:helix-turn-helix domain-containing protein [Pseudomonas sp.]MDP3815718.1 helix-turn-helix domain-containing protein [Pseudomonas sp.]
MTQPKNRTEAADACIEILDTDFFRALCEPARIQIFRVLVLQGRSDIGSIAETMPQDRSVIARHLQTMERAGLLRAQTEGRHTFYEIDGPTIAARVEQIAGLIQTLVPLCCGAPNS